MGTVTQVGAAVGKAPAAEELVIRPLREQWIFVFQPLYTDYDPTAVDGICSSRQMTGCACACIGPIIQHDDNDGDNLNVRIKWTSIHDLISWHCY